MAYNFPKSIENGVSVVNLGVTYSASTFSITAQNGTALSATNFGTVVMNSAATSGLIVSVPVVANQTFIDDSGSSTIVGNLFGFTNTDIMASLDVPFYLYAVINDSDNAIAFGISRTPAKQRSPVAGLIGKTGSAVASTNDSMFLFGNPTVADYDTNPCMMIGSFNMRLTTAGGDWTVQALSDFTGIGRFQEGVPFSLGTGVFGAATGSLFKTNGGTAPIWTTQQYGYMFFPHDALCFIYIQISGVSVAGAGAVVAHCALPMGHADLDGTSGRGPSYNLAGALGEVIVEEGSTGDDLDFITVGTYSTNLDLAAFSTNPQLRVNVLYPIYTG